MYFGRTVYCTDPNARVLYSRRQPHNSAPSSLAGSASTSGVFSAPTPTTSPPETPKGGKLNLTDEVIQSFNIAKSQNLNTGNINHLAFSDNGDMLISSSNGHSITAFDCRDGTKKHPVYCKNMIICFIELSC